MAGFASTKRGAEKFSAMQKGRHKSVGEVLEQALEVLVMLMGEGAGNN